VLIKEHAHNVSFESFTVYCKRSSIIGPPEIICVLAAGKEHVEFDREGQVLVVGPPH